MLNLKIVFDKIYVYGKHIANIWHGQLLLIVEWSNHFAKHIKYVANKLNLKIIKQ
jgi:hypothetical protein